MTQEEKNILLKDLCARVNCKVMCSIYRIDDYNVGWRDEILTGYFNNGIVYEFYFGETPISIDDISKVKPYLRPLSSMTDEEKNELLQLMGRGTDIERVDFYISHYFDYRCLIPMGLALEAPKDMYKI